ncbi:MAG: ATP-binding protein, partial [Chloroflexota bacterium]
MMLDNLQTQINDGQGTMLGWVLESDELSHIAETMVAMANSNGGTVIMGIDNKHIVGVYNQQEASDYLIEAALSTEPPLIIPVPEIVEVEGKILVMAQIPSGMPHVYADADISLHRHK